MGQDAVVAEYARRWSVSGRLRVLAEDLRLGFLLGVAAFVVLVLIRVAGLMTAEEEYAGQMHWAFVQVLGAETGVPLAAGLAAFGLLAAPAIISAWSDLRFARWLVWQRVTVPRSHFACRSYARPWRWQSGLGLVSTGICLMLFIGEYLWAQPTYPPYFDPVVLPEADYRTDDHGNPKGLVVVSVLQDGRYMLNGEECSPTRLMMLLQPLSLMHPDADGLSALSIKIRADYRVQWKSVDRVLDICRELRIWRVSFGVRVKGGYW